MLSSDLLVVLTLPSGFREDSMYTLSLLEKWLNAMGSSVIDPGWMP